ncbi:Permease of the drug/metabolite transporter (DMT) superfamily [Succinivibrio dextrinosolvens]|uniref:DMT family transporter n=1 Tax=Succinivibrio dextrinosolvens TaxID=83771 RepID=UPI0008F32308|nr:DMT family transporter [Succinivibrio dextrinosolvens]SFS34940.1 Permease of the drug/metabolite transporter (DMT) superfamily [Succinivibrio dextrinosolvens]
MFEFRQYLLLFITATIWGSGFVAQKLGMSFISPFAFTFFRTLLGALFLIPVILFIRRYRQKHQIKPQKINKRYLVIGSLCCGFFLILSESLQQFGLVTADVNKASFITSLYMIFVPILGIFLGHRITLKIVIAVIISCIGLYFFCIKDEIVFEQGDLLVFLCAIGFACHILVIAYFINHVNGVILSCGQFFCASFLGFLMMCFTGFPSSENLIKCIPALLYAGIMSNGVAYTLQIVAQKGINPTVASLILSLESVMGALFGIMFLNEVMTVRELSGAALMFTAIIITQLKLNPSRKNSV